MYNFVLCDYTKYVYFFFHTSGPSMIWRPLSHSPRSLCLSSSMSPSSKLSTDKLIQCNERGLGEKSTQSSLTLFFKVQMCSHGEHRRSSQEKWHSILEEKTCEADGRDDSINSRYRDEGLNFTSVIPKQRGELIFVDLNLCVGHYFWGFIYLISNSYNALQSRRYHCFIYEGINTLRSWITQGHTASQQ